MDVFSVTMIKILVKEFNMRVLCHKRLSNGSGLGS